jgi:hypothetical protein
MIGGRLIGGFFHRAENFRLGTADDAAGSIKMEYRGFEYTIVQGVGQHMWKWSAFISDGTVAGQSHTKAAAVAAAQKTIDRALAIKKVRLVPPVR